MGSLLLETAWRFGCVDEYSYHTRGGG